MSRTARTILAGVVAAGALIAGAGAAYADDSDSDSGSGSSASSDSSDSSDSSNAEGSDGEDGADGDEVSADSLPEPASAGPTDPISGLLSSLPISGLL